MGSAVVRITLFGLLLALVIALPNKDDWDIYHFHINSTVTSRYATTVITSRVANRMNEPKEIEFQVRIPKNAFISKFRMRIDGQDYNGVVKAKEQAKQQYTHAVSRGQSAGLVSSVGRTLEEFKTSVTVAAHKKVTFELTYEELLKRRLGKYELQIHARPMQPVKDFKVDVHINENAGINFIEVKGGLTTGVLANTTTIQKDADKQAWLSFYPTEDQQKTCQGCGDQGLNGDLVIVYDVNRDASLGDIKTSDGYFVHHFAPYNLPRIPKNVVFIIDQSGSMHGKKIQQTRTALIHILKDLAEDDYFGLITFDSSIFHWKRELVQATEENLSSARAFALAIQDRGATDINAAVLEGARMLNLHPREGSASILILLTDGDPTAGVTNLETIQSNVRKAIADKFPLYCLGFGFDVNFEFLEKMSLQNDGVARRIYEDSDADLQLKGFYEEVATPLLTDVTMTYVGSTNLTQTTFSQYYNGSEIVVAGQLIDNNVETFIPQVVAISKNQRIVFSEPTAPTESTKTVSDDRIQRVWAYLTVKQLLEKELQLSGSEKDKVEKEALRLSLKYSFVTPHTSMVVTKPQGENTDVLHKPKEGEKPDPARHGASAPRVMGYGGYGHFGGGGYGHFGAGGGYGHFGGVDSQPGLPGPPGAPGPPDMGFAGGHYGSSATVSRFRHTGLLRQGVGSRPVTKVSRVIQTESKPVVPVYSGQSMILPETHVEDELSEEEADYPFLSHTTSLPATHAPILHRFLRKTVNSSLPLCFDLPGSVSLKLLHHPNRELSVNGELDSVTRGSFKRIVIHFKTEHHVEIDAKEITVRNGQTETHHTGDNFVVVAESLTVNKRDKEINVSVGDLHMTILIQVIAAEEFHWPVLRQKPSDTNITGILALEPVVYEELQQTPSRKLKINNQEIDVTRSIVFDHSIISLPALDCWLMSPESALQGSLDDFIVTQL